MNENKIIKIFFDNCWKLLFENGPRMNDKPGSFVQIRLYDKKGNLLDKESDGKKAIKIAEEHLDKFKMEWR